MEEREKGTLFKKGLKAFSRFGKSDVVVDLPTADKDTLPKKVQVAIASNGVRPPSDPENVLGSTEPTTTSSIARKLTSVSRVSRRFFTTEDNPMSSTWSPNGYNRPVSRNRSFYEPTSAANAREGMDADKFDQSVLPSLNTIRMREKRFTTGRFRKKDHFSQSAENLTTFVPAEREFVVQVFSNLWEGQSLLEVRFRDNLSARELVALLFKQFSLKLKKTDAMMRSSLDTERTYNPSEMRENDLSPRYQDSTEVAKEGALDQPLDVSAAGQLGDDFYDKMGLFIPPSMYEEFLSGHWLRPTENINQYITRHINWLEFKTKQITARVAVPNLQVQKTVVLKTSYTTKDAFERIMPKVRNHFNAEQQKDVDNAYTFTSYAIFATATLDGYKETNYGIWIPDNSSLENYDLVNHGCLLVRKREWTIKVQYIDPASDTMRSTDSEPNYMRTKTLKVDPYSMVADVRGAIVHSVLSMKPDPEDFVLFIQFQPDSAEKTSVRNSLDFNNKRRSGSTTGVWMTPSKLLLEYYNTYEGWINDTILVKKFQRTQTVQTPDGILRRMILNEMDPVSQVVHAVAQKFGIKKAENFALKVLHPSGSESILEGQHSLFEQGVSETDTLIITVRYMLSDVNTITVEDDFELFLYYCQMRNLVISAKFTLSPKILVSLCAWQLRSDHGEYDPTIHKVGYLHQLETSGEAKFPTGIVHLENDVYQKLKHITGQSQHDARFNYIQMVKSHWFTSDDIVLKSNKVYSTSFETTIKGVTPIDFLKKTKYKIDLDVVHKMIHFSEAEGKVVLTMKNLNNSIVKVEKSLEDTKVLWMNDYFDDVTSTEKNCEITFQSHVEREYFYLAVLNLLNVPNRQKISVYTGTWNLGSAAPPNLESWIPTNKGFDIYAIGVQECKWKKDSDNEITSLSWSEIIQNHVGAGYEKVAEVTMWEIALLVLAKSSHMRHITNVETSTKATGIANVCGNKGGVGISLRIYDTSYCFINSHLPARAERILNRNQDYSNLVDGLNLGIKRSDILHQFHYVFWLGDLNYRIDASREVILKLVEQKNWDMLTTYDQLRNEKNAHRTLLDFSEGKITFSPTYRYERGSNEWSKKKLKNVPSYCDRILWRCLPGYSVTQHTYACASDITTSDHRPVYSTFTTDVKIPTENFAAPSVQTGKLVLYDLHIRIDHDDNYPIKRNPSNQRTTMMPAEHFLVVKAPFLQEVTAKQIPLARTPNLSKPGRSCWRQAVDVIGPFVALKSYVQAEYLQVQMFTVDEQCYGRHVVIGSACIPLHDACFHHKPLPFSVKLSFRGIWWGTLSGYIQLVWRP